MNHNMEMVAGTESGVNMEVGTDLKSVVDMSGNVGVAAGAEAGAVSAMVSVAVDMGSMVAGTCTSSDAEPVVEV